MATAERKVGCLLGDGFEDSEFRVPNDRLTAQGFKVEIIGAEKGQHIEGKKCESTAAERSIDDARPEDYIALLVPGGASPDHLRADPRFVEFVKGFDKLGRPMALICHGPQLLMTAGLVKGRTLTAWTTVQADLKLAGAIVKDEPVVRDRNWVTSRKPADLELFSDALLKMLS